MDCHQMKARTERMDVETRKSKMEVSLETNLVKRKSELESEMEGVDLADRSQTLQAHKIQLQGLTQQLSELTSRFQVCWLYCLSFPLWLRQSCAEVADEVSARGFRLFVL